MEIYQNERTDKYDIPLNHLDHSYVKSCSDEKELEKIIKVLRSGYEGTYPDLEILAEEKLASLKPESKVLRKEKPIRSKHDVGKKEWSELSDDMKSWEEDMKAKDAERQNIPATNSSLPPVRGQQKFVGSTPVETAKSNKKPMPRNHKEWDKVDIDAEIAKVDEEGPKKTVIKDKTEVSPDIYTDGLTAEEKAFKAEQEKNKGNEAFRAGDYEEAQLYYRRSLCIQESAAVYNNRAQTFIKVNKWAEACRDCDSVLRLEPDNIKAYMRRAVARQGKKDYKPAKSDLQYVLTREPGNKRAQDILKEVEKALMEQKVKGRRMVIEEVEGSSDEEAEEQAKETVKEAKPTDNGTHNGLQNGDINDHPAGKVEERISGNNPKNMNSVQVNGVHEETDTEKNITAPETNLPSETETSGKTQTEIPDTKTETKSSSESKGVQDTQSENSSESSPMDTQPEVPAPLVHTPPPPLPPAVVTLKDRGTQLYKAGQYSEAISQYQKAVNALERAGPAHRPSLCVMYSNVAACHLKLGDCGACIEDCSRALEINPAGTKALLRRAAAYETKEKLRAAYVDYRQVLLLDSSSTPAQQGSSRCSQALRAQDGVRWREKLPAVAPVAQSLHSLHQQYHETPRTTPQQQPPSKPAASTKSTGTETTKPAPTVTKPAPTETKPAPTAKTKTSEELGDEYKTEGNNLVKKGRYSEAIPWYTKCIEACSGNVAAYSNRALCYLKTGQSGTEEFIHTVFAIVEAIAQHPSILLEHHSLVINNVLPPLAVLVAGAAGDTRALSMRLFSEMACVYLTKEQQETKLNTTETKQLYSIVSTNLLPLYEQLLLEQDPLPSYSLKLLSALMEQNPNFIREFEKLVLGPVLFQVLIDHQNNPVSSTMQQVAAVLHCLLTHRETNLRLLFDQGLVDHLTHLFLEVATLCINSQDHTALKTPTSILLSLLDTLHCALKFVSEVVRKALQSKKSAGDAGTKEAERAETLLLMNKPFTDLLSLLTQLLTYDDSDIADLGIKCLSLLVQLFGGENSDAMSSDNMSCYSKALKAADGKKQKVILRIIKRLISTERSHCETMRKHGETLADTIKSLVHTASSNAEVAVTTLATDILKATGFL